MRAGQLRHQIEIQKPIEALSGYGEPARTWKRVASRPASIRQLTGQELFNAQQVQADVTHEVKLRYVCGVEPKMRVYWKKKDKHLNIENVNDVEGRGIELILMCQEAKE